MLILFKKAGIKEPEFIDFGDAMRVNIYHPSDEAQNKTLEEVLIELIKKKLKLLE